MTAATLPTTSATRPTRRTWFARMTNHLGAYGITAAMRVGTLAAFVPMCAPARTVDPAAAVGTSPTNAGPTTGSPRSPSTPRSPPSPPAAPQPGQH